MVVSLRKMAECLGFPERFSILFDFLGYRTFLDNRNISLLRQVQLLQNRYFNLNIIRVGIDLYTPDNLQTIDDAIQTARNIYATVNLGIGRVDHYDIRLADDPHARALLSDDDEARALTAEWNAPNSSLDVFFVLNSWNHRGNLSTGGLSAVKGPCNKDENDAMTGSVVAIMDGPPQPGAAHALAHEVGHYLGLNHVCKLSDNSTSCMTGDCTATHASSLMHPCLFTNGTGTPTSINLSNTEGETMRGHCFVNDGCPGN